MKIPPVLQTWRESRAQKRQNEQARHLRERIQVREFNGLLYISYDGIPLIPTESLNEPIDKVLFRARATALRHLNS